MKRDNANTALALHLLSHALNYDDIVCTVCKYFATLSKVEQPRRAIQALCIMVDDIDSRWPTQIFTHNWSMICDYHQIMFHFFQLMKMF